MRYRNLRRLIDRSIDGIVQFLESSRFVRSLVLQLPLRWGRLSCSNASVTGCMRTSCPTVTDTMYGTLCRCRTQIVVIANALPVYHTNMQLSRSNADKFETSPTSITNGQGRAVASNRPWLIRQTGYMSSGVTNSGAPANNLSEERSSSLASSDEPPFQFHPSDIWRGGPPGWRTNRPTWQVPGGPVRPCEWTITIMLSIPPLYQFSCRSVRPSRVVGPQTVTDHPAWTYM